MLQSVQKRYCHRKQYDKESRYRNCQYSFGYTKIRRRYQIQLGGRNAKRLHYIEFLNSVKDQLRFKIDQLRRKPPERVVFLLYLNKKEIFGGENIVF